MNGLVLRSALSLALLATAGSTPIAAQETSGPHVAAIIAYEHAACDAYRRNDAAAIDSLIGPGYELTDSKGVITTKADDIKAAYKALVKKHHPDANGGDRGSEERFRAVIQAYQLLKQAGFC